MGGNFLRRLRAILVATIPLALMAGAANAQSSSRATSASASTIDDTTYVVDSKGTTVYRNGVPLCHVNCGPSASTAFPRPPQGGRTVQAPSYPDRAVSADRYPRPPDDLNPRTPYRSAYPHDVPRATPVQRYPIPPDATAPASSRPSPPPQQSPPIKLSQKKTTIPPPDEPAPLETSGGLTKEQKALILNVGAVGAITAYGVGYWDYFQTAPKADSEGWFGRTTKSGGADKLGHFWATYAVSHLFAHVYRWWDFDADQANTLGAVSSLGIQTLMEIGDSFSGDFGFSYEDALMNAAGAGAAYLLGKYPWLADKIAFRLEFRPESFSDLTGDLLTNYERQRYLIALKLDGFEVFRDSYLSYLELHAGYYARNYEGYTPGAPDNRERDVFLGVGFNVNKLVRHFVDVNIFDYVQVPYTSLNVTKSLD
jgi:hypothetical protein